MFVKKMFPKKKRATKGQQQDAADEEGKNYESADDFAGSSNNGGALSPTPRGNLTPVEREYVPLDIHKPVLTETGYEPVSTVRAFHESGDEKFTFVVAKGSADSWKTLRSSFEDKYGPFDHEPTSPHPLICWFARCPKDLDRVDVVEELVRTRDKLARRDKSRPDKDLVVASVFFADPTFEHDQTALDPFQETFDHLAMKSVVNKDSVFVFFLSELWFRDQQGQKMVDEAEATLAASGAAFAAALAEKDKTIAEERATRAAAEERVRELEQQLACK